MAKLDSYTATQGPIGRDGLRALCDELNGMRYAKNISPGFLICEVGGVWTLHDVKTDGPLKGRPVYP